MSREGPLAIFGGDPAIRQAREDLFQWPVLGREEEQEVLRLMRRPSYLDSETVTAFEEEFAAWCGTRFALSESCGTHAVLGALFACGVGVGDEVVAPSSTYWATVLPCFTLGATVVFADLDPLTLNLDPSDVERRITPQTKAIVVVHQLGYPVDMDAINDIARRHSVRVVEDASHAHGSLYKGRKTGTLGDIAAFSLCGKPLAVGEGGMIVTDDHRLYERAVAWGHNFRFHGGVVKDCDLLRFAGLPMGGVTSRMHNLSAAIGRVQLRAYDTRMAEIDLAMNHFWDLLEDIPAFTPLRPPRGSGSTMGGWYEPHGIYHPHVCSGLSVAGFIDGVRAEGYWSQTRICIREPLHLHPLLNEADVYGHGVPTRLANAVRDVRQPAGSLPMTESVSAFTVPPFRRFDSEAIEEYASVFRKVYDHHGALLAIDRGDAVVCVDEHGNG